MQRRILAVILLLTSLNVSAQQLNKAKLDSLFDRLAEKDKAMMSVAISKNGQLIYTKATGFSDISGGKRLPVTPKTKYRVGSITKMFTGVILFQLIEEKKLSLEDKLSRYFPSVPNADKISIAHMLTHKSGIHNITNDSLYGTYYTSAQAPQQVLDRISATTPDFEPGEKSNYSNSAFILLGRIAEKITGKSYASLVKERIIDKLSLTDTYIGSKINTTNNEAKSFKFLKSWNEEMETDMSIPFSAGAIVSTPTDLTKFIDALFSGKLISSASLEQMKKIDGRYGHAMMRFPFNQKQIFGHTGGIDGFSNMAGFIPGDSLSFAWSSNAMNTNGNEANLGILNIVYNLPYNLPSWETYAHTEAELDAFAGTYKSKDIPLVLTITKEKGTLVVQATGQNAAIVSPTSKNVFEYERAGAKFTFDPAAKQVTLKQGGANLLFTKE